MAQDRPGVPPPRRLQDSEPANTAAGDAEGLVGRQRSDLQQRADRLRPVEPLALGLGVTQSHSLV